jgi:hypothetical protein
MEDVSGLQYLVHILSITHETNKFAKIDVFETGLPRKSWSEDEVQLAKLNKSLAPLLHHYVGIS